MDGYSRGWTDAMKAAKESVGTYLGFPSANGVMGFGPDAVIVDGDWLVRKIANAWDEGYIAGSREDHEDFVEDADNPYREEYQL